MRKFLLALTVPALVSATAAAANPWPTENDERLASPAQRDIFLLFSTDDDKERPYRIEVERFGSFTFWKRMITTQRFAGVAARMTAPAYARVIGDMALQKCPEAKLSRIVNLTVSGRPASRFEIACPQLDARQAVTTLVLVVAGKNDMHVKQVGLRGVFLDADLNWAENYLMASVLCLPGDQQEICHPSRLQNDQPARPDAPRLGS